jgi:hypothetical protein
LTDFLAADAHAFGMRNRQVKMVSGLATEPVRSLPEHSWAGYPEDNTGRGIIKPEDAQMPGPPSEEYQLWAADALALAKWRLARMDGVLVAERLAESLSVLMVHFLWVPLLGDVTPNTPRGAVQLTKDYPALMALKAKQTASPGTFVRQDKHVLTMGLNLFGINLDHTVHVNWSSCEQRFQRVRTSAQEWTTLVPMDAQLKPAGGDKRRLQEGTAGGVWGGAEGAPPGPAAAVAGGVEGDGEEGKPAAPGPSTPEQDAGLNAWDMLVCISSHMAEQFREMDKTDLFKLEFPVEGQLKDRLMSLNELDTNLHAYAVELLDARVAHSKRWLASNADWAAQAMQWGNTNGLPAAPVPM